MFYNPFLEKVVPDTPSYTNIVVVKLHNHAVSVQVGGAISQSCDQFCMAPTR